MLKKERIGWIDTLKFLGIFAIYLGHLGNQAGNSYNFVFQYHVPLFFFISGCFNKKIELDKYINYMKEVFKKYMYPYYLFSLIAFIFLSIRNNSFNSDLLISFIKGIRNNVWGGLWFFSCLFIVKILYNFVLSMTKNKIVTFVISLLFYIISMKYLPHIPIREPKWFYNIDSALFYIIFYSLGDIIFPYLKKYYNSKYCIVLYCISCLVAFDLFFGKNYFKILKFLQLNSNIFYLLFIGLLLINFNILLSIFLSKIEIFKKIGKETLILCGNEQIGKLIFGDLLYLFGISLKIHNPLIAVIETYIVLFLIYKFLVPIYKKYI